MRPLVAERQRERVEGYIGIGRSEGARIATGGGRPGDQGRGYYVVVHSADDQRTTDAARRVETGTIGINRY